jgi:hypothetical protein
MFDTLTDDERTTLRRKLHDWGHAFAEIGNPILFAALAIGSFGADHDILWKYGQRYTETMTELYALAKELAA